MNVEQITTNVEAVFERARDALTQEVSTTRATLQKLQGEITDAKKALGDIHNEHKRVEADLSNVMKDLHRASTKVSLDHEIKEARKTLEGLKAEITQASTALEGFVTQRRAAEGQVAALRMEVSSLAAAKAETEARMQAIREQLSR